MLPAFGLRRWSPSKPGDDKHNIGDLYRVELRASCPLDASVRRCCCFQVASSSRLKTAPTHV